MAEEKSMKTLSSKLGAITVADEVVAITAGLAAAEVEGVASMSGGIASGIAERIGSKNLTRGVKVDAGEEEAAIDIYVIISYGYRIPQVSKTIQEEVRKAIEATIGLKVTQVNVHVQGINLPTPEGEEEEAAEEKE